MLLGIREKSRFAMVTVHGVDSNLFWKEYSRENVKKKIPADIAESLKSVEKNHWFICRFLVFFNPLYEFSHCISRKSEIIHQS